MPLDVLDLVRKALQTESPWAQYRRRYNERKALTATVWAGIDERCQFVAQHCSGAVCVPVRRRHDDT